MKKVKPFLGKKQTIMPAVLSKLSPPILIASEMRENLKYKISQLMEMSFDESDNFPSEQAYLAFTDNLMFINKEIELMRIAGRDLCCTEFFNISQDSTVYIFDNICYDIMGWMTALDKIMLQFPVTSGIWPTKKYDKEHFTKSVPNMIVDQIKVSKGSPICFKGKTVSFKCHTLGRAFDVHID